MNIIAIRQDGRMNKIASIIGTIKKAFENGMDVNYEKLVNETCFSQMVARRTAIDYLNVALSQIEHTIIKEKDVKLICPTRNMSKEEEKNTKSANNSEKKALT